MSGNGRTDKRCALKERVYAWAVRVKVTPTQVRIQSMTRKWASCSPLGWISLAEDLADQPDDFQDYVIVHELLHLRVPNHGKLFKSLMSIYVPNWRDLERPSSRGELVSGVTRHVGQHATDSARGLG